MMAESRLKWSALSGIIPAACLGAIYLYCPYFPYPDNNVEGQIIIDFLRARRDGEVQGILGALYATGFFLFLVVLANEYRTGSQGTALVRRVISGAGAAYLTVWLIAMACYSTISLLADGYHDFDSLASNRMLATTLFNLINVFLAYSSVPMACAAVAVMIANRSHPVLPSLLGGWGASAVAVINAGHLVTIFIHTGHWSPGSLYSLGVCSAVNCLWAACSGILLLRHSGTDIAGHTEAAIAQQAGVSR